MLREPNVGEAAHAAETGSPEKLPLRETWIPNSLIASSIARSRQGQDSPPAVSPQCPLLRGLNIPDPFAQSRHVG